MFPIVSKQVINLTEVLHKVNLYRHFNGITLKGITQGAIQKVCHSPRGRGVYQIDDTVWHREKWSKPKIDISLSKSFFLQVVFQLIDTSQYRHLMPRPSKRLVIYNRAVGGVRIQNSMTKMLHPLSELQKICWTPSRVRWKNFTLYI